jgi:hypothetical protein
MPPLETDLVIAPAMGRVSSGLRRAETMRLSVKGDTGLGQKAQAVATFSCNCNLNRRII